MKVLFKGPVKVDGQLFNKGVHSLPDKMAKHWYIKALVKSNHAEIVSSQAADPDEADADETPKAKKAGAPVDENKAAAKRAAEAARKKAARDAKRAIDSQTTK